MGDRKKKKIRRVTLTPALIIIGGKSKKQIKGGTSNTITVPPVQIPYNDPGNNTSKNITDSIKVDATLKANSEFDNQVGKTGGQKGGWPKWGCMSGGIKSKRKSRVKCIKTKKSRKCRRRKR